MLLHRNKAALIHKKRIRVTNPLTSLVFISVILQAVDEVVRLSQI